MTPVLKDAIIACRTLGIRYIWIDALCILQDDHNDCEEQSYQMSRIFGESWLTTCATASSSCLEGFLEHPDRRTRQLLATFASQGSPTTVFMLFIGQVLRDGKLIADPPSIDLPPLELDLRSS